MYSAHLHPLKHGCKWGTRRIQGWSIGRVLELTVQTRCFGACAATGLRYGLLLSLFLYGRVYELYFYYFYWRQKLKKLRNGVKPKLNKNTQRNYIYRQKQLRHRLPSRNGLNDETQQGQAKTNLISSNRWTFNDRLFLDNRLHISVHILEICEAWTLRSATSFWQDDHYNVIKGTRIWHVCTHQLQQWRKRRIPRQVRECPPSPRSAGVSSSFNTRKTVKSKGDTPNRIRDRYGVRRFLNNDVIPCWFLWGLLDCAWRRQWIDRLGVLGLAALNGEKQGLQGHTGEGFPLAQVAQVGPVSPLSQTH